MITFAKYLPRFRAAYRAFDELEDRESWSRAQIEQFQLQRLNDVWTHAIQHVPYYRRIYAELKLLPHFQSLEEFKSVVPILSKEYLRAHSPEFCSERARPGSWHCTSGSTGTPLKAFRAHDAHQEMLRTNYRYYRMWGHDIFDPTVFLWNVSSTQSNGLAGTIKGCGEFVQDKLRNRLRLSALTLGREDLQTYLHKISRFRPSAIYSYSRAAYLLALAAKTQRFKCPSLKVINLTSEPVSAHIVKTIEDAFNVPCVEQYGCVEFGYIAGEWPDRTLRVREDISLVETVCRNDGLFDLVLTNLNNPSFPLLRYSVGDVTNQELELPATGFAILNEIAGRCGDFLYTPLGRCLHPTTVDSIFENQYFQFVRRYQIHQHADGSVMAYIEPNDPDKIPNTQRLAKLLSLQVEGFPVEVRVVSSIQQTAAGKHRTVTSDRRPDLISVD
jgi:phenylacetate-CoA ligase